MWCSPQGRSSRGWAGWGSGSASRSTSAATRAWRAIGSSCGPSPTRSCTSSCCCPGRSTSTPTPPRPRPTSRTPGWQPASPSSVTHPRSAAPAELDSALWRAVSAFRIAALAYALLSIAAHYRGYDDQRPALAVAAIMTVWTAVMLFLGRSRLWLVLDVLVALGCQQASLLALSAHQVDRGDPTLPVTWVAGPVVAWAVLGGWVGGLVASSVLAVGAVVERGGLSQATVNSVVLLVLGGTVVGYLVVVGRRAGRAYAEAVRLAAENTERERLARSVHDGVLQALALVARTSDDPALVSLAGGQEQALRRLVSGAPEVGTGRTDLRALLPVRPGVEVA